MNWSDRVEEVPYEERLENVDFWEDSVKEIAETFLVPPRTAQSWQRNIGETDIIKSTLGQNGPNPYLDLIRRREWIPYERQELEKEWVEPVKRWCVERCDGVHLKHESEEWDLDSTEQYTGYRSMGLGSMWYAVEPSRPSHTQENDDERGINWSDTMLALQDELEHKEEWIEYELRRYDSKWIELSRELWQVEKSLRGIYRDYLQHAEQDFPHKKDKIIELKEVFLYLRANDDLVADTIDCSRSYVSQFRGPTGGDITNHKVASSLKEAVHDRDGHSCVSCGSANDLVVHHIIPHSQGGENSKENLAVLCEECHYYAHGGGKPREEGRYTSARWQVVEYSDKSEFWGEWRHQSFDDRAPKGHTRADFDTNQL